MKSGLHSYTTADKSFAHCQLLSVIKKVYRYQTGYHRIYEMKTEKYLAV